MDDAIEDVLDRFDSYAVENAAFHTIESDPAWEEYTFGDLTVFAHEAGEDPVVYEAGGGFWPDDRYDSSPLSVLHEGDINTVSVYRLEEPLSSPVSYDVNAYDNVFDLFSTLYRSESDSLMMFYPFRENTPVVYDGRDDRFWSMDEYEESIHFAMEEVRNTDAFRSVLEDVEDAVSRYDTFSLFKDPSRRGFPTVVGAAADGEGIVVGRSNRPKSCHDDELFDLPEDEITEDQEVYHLVHVKAGPLHDFMDEAETRIDRVTSVTFDHDVIPTGGWAFNKRRFAQNQILLKHADRNGEVAAEFHRAYLNGRRDDQFERLLPPGHK